MSKDDGSKNKKNPPRVDFIHFKNNDPSAFYSEEDCKKIRYCWGDEMFSSGVVFKSIDDLKKFDVAKQRGDEYDRMMKETGGATKYIRKRPAAKSLIKKKPPKLVDVTNNKSQNKSSTNVKSSKPAGRPKDDNVEVPRPRNNSTDKQFWDRKNHRFVTVPGGNNGDTAEEKKKEEKRGKWLDEEYEKMNALLKAANDVADHPSVKDAENGVDAKDIESSKNESDEECVQDEEVNDGVHESGFCQLCWKNPCEWFDYAVDVLEKDRAYEPLHYGVMSTWAIRNAHSERRTELTHLCDRISARGNYDPAYSLRCPLPDCVRDQIRALYPDPENNYSGFYPPNTYERII